MKKLRFCHCQHLQQQHHHHPSLNQLVYIRWKGKKNTLNVLRNISMSKQYVHYYCYLQAWCCYSCYFVAIPSRIFIYVHIFRRKQKEKFFKEIFLWRNQRAIMLSYLLLCLRLVCRGTSIIEFQIAQKQQNFLSLNKKKIILRIFVLLLKTQTTRWLVDEVWQRRILSSA